MPVSHKTAQADPFARGFANSPWTGVAFELTRAALRISNQDDLASEIIAESIIELTKAGERDPERLCDQALASLREPPPQI